MKKEDKNINLYVGGNYYWEATFKIKRSSKSTGSKRRHRSTVQMMSELQDRSVDKSLS